MKDVQIQGIQAFVWAPLRICSITKNDVKSPPWVLFVFVKDKAENGCCVDERVSGAFRQLRDHFLPWFERSGQCNWRPFECLEKILTNIILRIDIL